MKHVTMQNSELAHILPSTAYTGYYELIHVNVHTALTGSQTKLNNYRPSLN